MDVLTEVLAAVRRGPGAAVRTDAYAPWGLRMAGSGAAQIHAVLSGGCWLRRLGDNPALRPDNPALRPDNPALRPDNPALRLDAGDLVLLPRGDAHSLADDPGSPLHDLDPACATIPAGLARVGGGGARTRLLCASFLLDRRAPHPMLAALPPVVHIPAGQRGAQSRRAAVELLAGEVESPGPGTPTVVNGLVAALFGYALRGYVDARPGDGTESSWALTDPAIGTALARIHAHPAHPWTVEALAGEANLSRAAFARRFVELVGEPPMTYLTHWRMAHARALLRDEQAPVAVVARAVGYHSPFAFAKAFKRHAGEPPARYRRLAA